MEPLTFYSLERRSGELRAAERVGHTDGTYNYYYNDSQDTWYAIDPACGYAVCRGDTLLDAQKEAYSVQMQTSLEIFKRSVAYDKYVDEFRNALWTAGVMEYDVPPLSELL